MSAKTSYLNFVSNSDYSWCTLASGLSIVYRYTNSDVSYCGFVIDAGTRDEVEGEEGLAHYVEHMLFKGTSNHKASHILNCMESVGGELNAFTSKEETVIYAVSLEPYLKRAVSLMCDIIQNSNLPDSESIKEKEVIIDEINSYFDNPAEYIYDEFENLIFNNHPLGHNILGDIDSLERITPQKGMNFIKKFYSSENMVFFFTGRTKFEKVISIIENATIGFRDNKPNLSRNSYVKHSCFSIHKECDNYQSHAIIGGLCHNLFDKERFNLFLLNNILGGPGMNSMLNIALREKRGYVYSVESSITNYSDTGLFTIYFGTDKKNIEKCFEITHRQLSKLCNKELSSSKLLNAKRQYIGQLTIGRENRENLAIAAGKSLLRHNKCRSLNDSIERIERITSKDILECANKIYNKENLSALVLG